MNADEAREILQREQEARDVLQREKEAAKIAAPLVTATLTNSLSDIGGIKVSFTIWPMSFEVNAEPEKIVMLVKRMVQEFMAAGIIAKSSNG